MFILPWIRQDGKKKISCVLMFMYEDSLWEADNNLADAILIKEYLEPNGFILGKQSFWHDNIWCPEISAKTDLGDFFFQKDNPEPETLRWKQFYWTKDNLGVNQFHKNNGNMFHILSKIFTLSNPI